MIPPLLPGSSQWCAPSLVQDRARFDQTLSVLCDNVGACERIFKSPIPLVYTRTPRRDNARTASHVTPARHAAHGLPASPDPHCALMM